MSDVVLSVAVAVAVATIYEYMYGCGCMYRRYREIPVQPCSHAVKE